MIELADVSREETKKVKNNIAIKILKEEVELEDCIRKSIKHGMNFTYVDLRLLVHSVEFVKEALEVFGYTVKKCSCNGNTEIKVEW